MVEVKTRAEDIGLIEIYPLKDISSIDRIVVKVACFLMSALKIGEPVCCCAAPEEETE